MCGSGSPWLGSSVGPQKRDTVVGVSITLAAWLLGVSRSRVHQLLKGRKLSAVDVYDERHVRIGHLVTLASIAHRRSRRAPEAHSVAINACITVCDLISDRAFAMYAGNTVPTEWPRRADRSTYETYAKLPSWHVEEAASLAADLIPRQNLHRNFRPIHSVPEEPKPYEDAKTSGALLDETEPVGRVMSLLARARGVSTWAFFGV